MCRVPAVRQYYVMIDVCQKICRVPAVKVL